MGSKRRRANRNPGYEQLDLSKEEPWIREDLLLHNLFLETRTCDFEKVRGKKRRTGIFWHWFVNDAQGRRIVDVWPKRGTYWVKETGEKGTLPSIRELPDLAIVLSEKMYKDVKSSAPVSAASGP